MATQQGAAIGAVMPGPGVTPGSVQQQAVPFRRATVERVDQLAAESAVVMTTSTQRIERTVEGSGYLFGILLDFNNVTSANAANVAYFEDAPWSALDTVVLRDVNGELVNLTGYSLWLANLINRNYALRWTDQSVAASQGSAGSGALGYGNITPLITSTGSTGGTGGSFRFQVRVPVGTNRRDLLGVLGNQDRAQKYSLRTDIAAGGASGTGPIYTTGPTSLGTVTLNKLYENYSVPLPVSPNGAPQQVFPPGFGTLHFTTQTVSDAAPVSGSTVNHFLRRIGNTVRWIALVFRSTSGGNLTRAGADTAFAGSAPPYSANLRFKVGEDTLFNEPYWYRRALMFERFGFELPAGVLVYDAIHDFAAAAAFELGDDYYHTQALVNAQFQVSYPALTAPASLTIITDDLIYVPPVVGVSAAG